MAHGHQCVDLVQCEPVFGLEVDAQIGHASRHLAADGARGGTQVGLPVLHHRVPLGVDPPADVTAV